MQIKRQTIRLEKTGGTSGKESIRSRIDLPPQWIREMDASEVELIFSEGEIRIRKRLPDTPDEMLRAAISAGHNVKRYGFFDGDVLCSKICVDFTAQQVAAENMVEDVTRTAFGARQAPTWNDWLDFLEERCIPRQRAGLRHYLDALGLEEYDPFQIIQTTQGRMKEDDQWIGEI